jgi:hypothetical protein
MIGRGGFDGSRFVQPGLDFVKDDNSPVAPPLHRREKLKRFVVA